jgi:hypothetical protein
MALRMVADELNIIMEMVRHVIHEDLHEMELRAELVQQTRTMPILQPDLSRQSQSS